ncbi:MAG: type VI secretion system baseplate subunit TssF [Fibromonadaceae bacterium]|nr:type VI secretion system baseplate subunit TssF [Fibromonadaceae bacterium]
MNQTEILSGLAALTARIRQEMAETENEIARDFVESVAPELLLPLPCRSLAEIIPSPNDNQKREIPCGALLCSKSKNPKEKPFFWRVAGSHILKPAQKIISAKTVQDSGGFDCIEFESSGSGPWIIYIAGESEFAWNLWHLILEYASHTPKPYITSKPQNPWELCRDFFCFEEKFRYIYMEELPSKLRFSKKIPKEIFSNISTENFKLNVLPIENTFKQNLEPILINFNDIEAKVLALEKRQSILKLCSVLAGNAGEANFKEMEYRYNGSEKISFANPTPNTDTLSISALVCDGNEATSLEQGSPLQAKNSSMQMCEIYSVLNATPFSPPLGGKSAEWQILALLQKNYLQFFEGNALKNALETQLWNVQGKRNYLVQSIKSLSLENKSAVHKGCLVPAASIKIIMNLGSIDNPGILKVFGEMLFYLFKKIFICNMLVELVLRIEPFGMELKWE